MAQVWKTVRVFISSTFRDMYAERDHLVKVAFPELRERMAKRNLYLVDVDLRWGVTEEEAEHGKALEVCLDEIERCRPFFIGILGERYGYVPAKAPEDTEFTHPWLVEYKGHSLTALEIIHGVLRNPELAQRAFFYFRDSRFISQVPEGKRADYVAESPEAAQKLTALKDKIRASGRPVMENYPCRWDDSQGRVVELEKFGQRVLEDLWAAICAAYPEKAVEVDPITVERQMHEAFAEERSRLHVGRDVEAKRLTEYVQGKECRPAVITGESGCGKSAFLANWYRKYVNDYPDDFVLAYFIGASSDSTNHFRLLRNMCGELKRQFGLKEEIPEDDKKLSEMLAVMLVSASQTKGRIVIVVDALDQLMPLEAAHGLGWLLDYMPEKARLVVSTLEGDCLDVLQRREAEEIALPPLTESDQRQIVHVLLSEWRRKLDGRQMAALLSHHGVKNPLYLRVALEELRLFGKFEQLTERIKTLAEDIPGLFGQVLARLEEDHGQDLVKKVFSLLGCSRHGLSESELLQLLSGEGREQFPRVLWARIYRISKMYLVQRGEFIGFFHRQLAEAVAARYPEHKKIHMKLAIDFLKMSKVSPGRKLDEVPFQLQQAEQWSTLAVALSEPGYLNFVLTNNRLYELIGFWQALKGRFDPSACYESALKSHQKSQNDTEDIGQFAGDIGFVLDEMGLYTKALQFKELSLKMRESTLASDDPLIVESISNLAGLCKRLGNYNEALDLCQRSLTITERAKGPDHPDVARILAIYSDIYIEMGNYVKALNLCQRSLKIFEQAEGPNNPNVAKILNTLANTYKSLEKYSDALPLYQRSLAIRELNYGPYHPGVALALNNLAAVYEKMGNYYSAFDLYKRSLDIRERILGPDHPDVAQSLGNLANVYSAQGKYSKALPLYQRALKIKEQTLGRNHPSVGISLNNLANLNRERGNHTEAERLYLLAIDIVQAKLGRDHVLTRSFQTNLKACQEEMQKG